MSLDRRSEGSVEVVTLAGNLNAAVATQTRDEILGVIESGRTRLVLDLGDVRFVDSSGLSVLVSTLKSARSVGGDVVLASLKPEVESIIELTRLHRVLALFGDQETAVASLAG